MNEYSVMATNKEGEREVIIRTKSKGFAERTAKRTKQKGCTKIFIDTFDEDNDLIDYVAVN